MSAAANAVRGEASFALGARTIVLRPSFAALVAAEAELGPLFALVERAAEGRLTLAEMTSLFCLAPTARRRATRLATRSRSWGWRGRRPRSSSC